MSRKRKHGTPKARRTAPADEPTAVTLDSILTDPDALKARFKQVRRSVDNTNWAIRVHRSISWYRKAMNIASAPETVHELEDAEFIFLWISLSALFGAWDPDEKRPAPEIQSLRGFLRMLQDIDESRVMPDYVGRNLATIRRLQANVFLCPEFWLNPFNPELAGKLKNTSRAADGKHLSPSAAYGILHDAFLRVYLLRSQVVHGASTSGGKLNRATMRDALRFLQRAVPAILNIVVESSSSLDWPPLCYPPVDPQSRQSLESVGRNL